MSQMSYEMLYRFIGRSHGIAAEPAVHPNVKSMHDGVLLPLATTYEATHDAVPVAETLAHTATANADEAIALLDPEYRMARIVVMALFPSTVVPGTLKEQPTEIERVASIRKLLALLIEHRGEAFADLFLFGGFGTMAPDTISKIDAATAAKSALFTAQAARSDAFDAVYPLYLAFKAMVRQAPGPFGTYYRRLQERVVPATATPPPTPEPPVVTAAPSNGAGAVVAH